MIFGRTSWIFPGTKKKPSRQSNKSYKKSSLPLATNKKTKVHLTIVHKQSKHAEQKKHTSHVSSNISPWRREIHHQQHPDPPPFFWKLTTQSCFFKKKNALFRFFPKGFNIQLHARLLSASNSIKASRTSAISLFDNDQAITCLKPSSRRSWGPVQVGIC